MTLSILLTGASGFVGRAVAQHAMERGHRVTLFDLNHGDGDSTADFVQGDVRDRSAIANAATSHDTIIHCAAVVGPDPARADPVRATSVNVDGTLAVLEALRETGAAGICLSTATLYGRRDNLAPLDETSPCDPVSVYDATKYMAEILATSYRKTFGCRVASFRTGFVYGLGHSTGDYYVHRLFAGETSISDTGADHPCDFTYLHDLATGLVAAAEAGTLPEPVYNLTGGILRKRSELARIVESHFPGARITQTPGVDPARHLRGPSMIERATRDFGYRPRYDLEAGIADMVRRVREAA